MIVGWENRGLNDVDMAPSDIFLHSDKQGTFGEPQDFRLSQGYIQVFADALGQLATTTAPENEYPFRVSL